MEIDRRQFLASGLAISAALASGCLPKEEFRTRQQAIISYNLRRFLNAKYLAESPLEKLLNTNLSESTQIGLVNSHLLEEYESADLGNISFAIKPWDPFIKVGDQKVPLLANTRSFTSFRKDPDALIRVFDRTVWAANSGRVVTAIIETDKATQENITFTTQMLLNLGIKNFRIGNETNNPLTPWLSKPQQIFEVASLVKQLSNAANIEAEVSFPALAYYGHGEHLRELVRHCRRQTKELPFSRYSFNFYGPSYDLIPRIRLMQSVAKQEGIDHLKLDISETGNPGPEIALENISDLDLAHFHIPQVLSLIIASKLVDMVDYFSLLNGGSDQHSLTRLHGRDLKFKESFQAFSVMAKLLAKLEVIELDQSKYTRVEGLRADDIHFSIVWANEEDIILPALEKDLVFDSLGRSIPQTGTILLKKRPKEYLGGEARIILHQN